MINVVRDRSPRHKSHMTINPTVYSIEHSVSPFLLQKEWGPTIVSTKHVLVCNITFPLRWTPAIVSSAHLYIAIVHETDD